MHIEVEKLDEAGESFAHRYAPDALALNDERARLIGETEVAGTARRKGAQVRVRGSLTGSVEVVCDRCLQPVALPLEIEFDVQYIPAEVARGVAENVELADEDLDASIYDDEAVDIDDLVREQVLLTLPLRVLCREDCKGLCPTCGADLNKETCRCEQREVDPRWAALADLKNGKT